MEILSLKSVKSYSPDVSTKIDLSKKINIFWGQNGSGKSTISGYFYNPSNPHYSKCNFNTTEHYRFLVYNSQFVEDSFYAKNEQPGIFSLSKNNGEIIKIIDELKQKEANLKINRTAIQNKIDELDIKTNAISTEFTDNVWEKTSDIRNSDLKTLLSGYLKKSKLSSNLEAIELGEDIAITDLIEEYNQLVLYKGTSLKKVIIPDTYQVTNIELELLKTPLISSGNSYLSELINKLSNSDWVQEGIDYIEDEQCPFCQKKTINSEFREGVKTLFDNTYKDKLEEIAKFSNKYESENINYIHTLEANLNSCEFIKKEHEIWQKIQDYENYLSLNIKEINLKKQKPSNIVELVNLSSFADEIIKIINNINLEIESINQKVSNYNKSLDVLRLKLWKKIRFECNDLIQIKNRELLLIENQNKKLEEQKKNILKEQADLLSEISEKEKEVSNMDETINHINETLVSLGIRQFKIAKHKSEENYFQLVRENETSENVYQSLSEGEKTIITFLYFVELCLGSTSDESQQNQDKFVVIDDPISSLSLHYIYEVASLINHRLLNDSGIKKIIILTHNLFFYKELVPSTTSMRKKVFNKKFMLYKVLKNEFSTVETLGRDEIKNDYQTLWMILKDAKNKKVNSVIVPNIMRNILEYYFSFQCTNEKLNNVLSSLTNDESLIENKAFYRYINNGSHSNSINSCGIISLPVERYFLMFENIFRITGNLQHYQNMIQEHSEDEE